MNQFIKNVFINLTPIPLTERLFFVRHLKLLLKSGISLSQALFTLSKQTENKRFSLILNNIGKEVESGKFFSASLSRYPKVFDALFISMVEVGETSGKLEVILEDLYVQIKKQHELLSKVKIAMVYPAVILMAVLLVGFFMMVAVVPKIIGIFVEFQAELPWSTKFLIATSRLINDYFWLFMVGLSAFVLLMIKVWKTDFYRRYLEDFIFKIPIFGNVFKKVNIARMARSLSTLLNSGVMIVQSFEITANTLNSLKYKEALKEISVKIENGESFTTSLENNSTLFPSIVRSMITVGEESGELEDILNELALFYENEVYEVASELPVLIEPILILILGIGVGIIAVAVIMPLYTITQVI